MAEHRTHKPGVVGSIPTPATARNLGGQVSMIKRIKGKYVVLSETTGRKFGVYNTLKEAKERLRQVEFFSAKGGSASGGKYAKKKGIKLKNKK